jgi:mannitol operon repressor
MIELEGTKGSEPEQSAWPPQHLAGFDAFFREMNKELNTATGRGLVMVSCSYIDELLLTILKSFMIDGESSAQLLEGFSAPLSTLSTRVAAAHALGLINDREYREITTLRRVRNRFAHKVNVSFDDQDIHNLTSHLTMVVPDCHPQGRYSSSSAAIILGLTNRAVYVSRKRLSYEDWLY